MRQRGFVQGALLLALALVGIVVGVFAMASSDAPVNVASERVKADALIVVRKVADAFDAYNFGLQMNLPDPYSKITAPNMPNGLVIDLTERSQGRVFVNLGAAETMCVAMNEALKKTISLETSYANNTAAIAAIDGEGCAKVGANYIYLRRFA